MTNSNYPLRLTIDYPETPNRLTTAFRLIVSIPIWIVSSLISSTAGILFLPAALMIVFRQKYPRWWFDWNRTFMRFDARVVAYAFLLTHEYPSTDEEQSIHLDFEYPYVQTDLNRWLPLVKWLLAIPHYCPESEVR